MANRRYPLRAPARRARVQPFWRRYVHDARQPLHCLLFLFPLVATYEFGAIMLRPAVWPDRQLVAHNLIQRLLGWFGGSGSWLPAVTLLLTLLIWHILVRHPWRISGWTLPLMAIESVVLSAPLFVLGQLMLEATSAPVTLDLRHRIVLDLGAGIYEELVFRLYLIAGLTLVLETLLRVPQRYSRPAVVILSALAFAACHFAPIGSEPFVWKRLFSLTVAGAYLSLVFMGRGLGIAAGCHAAFNLIPLIWQWSST